MQLDPAKVYSMPLIMGPVFDRESLPGRIYGETESLAVTFRTDAGAARALVPDCFSVPDDVTASAVFGDFDHVDFMAGGGYRVAYVGVSARYEGEEIIDGLCILVMWENETLPIVSGRELIGIPKGHADISSIRETENGGLRATASEWGHEVMRLSIPTFKEQNFVVRRAAQKRINAQPWLGYKHIAAIDGPPDASYPMVVWNEVEIDRLWLGDGGALEFGSADEDDLGQQAVVIRALRTLPIGEIVFAAHVRGSAVLRLDRSRRLG
ncbi:MAG: acetoacetate decarboxylase family protein [Acidimicrobiia bacterium]